MKNFEKKTLKIKKNFFLICVKKQIKSVKFV